MSEVTINRLRNAGNVCHDCGARWGEPRGGDCTQWYGTCGVCGQYKACCDTRNYGYLIKGRKELGEVLARPHNIYDSTAPDFIEPSEYD
jgi:hypothetical protein